MLVALGAYGLPAQSRNTGEHSGFHMGLDAVKTLRRVQIPQKLQVSLRLYLLFWLSLVDCFDTKCLS